MIFIYKITIGDMKGLIYKYTSPGGKIYVGQTTDVEKRRECFLDINTVYANKNLELTFPSAKVLALGRDIDNVLQSYDNIFTSAEPDYSYLQYSNLNPQLYEFLHEAQDEIRFFANKPQSFLTILTGANLNLKLSSVKGTFVSDPKVENQYLVDLTFNFQNEKFLKAGRTLLSLAFGLTDSQTYTDNNNVLIIKGIKINKDSLYRLIKI